ncbi:hypothetical protein PV326_011851 [Microctonus aethiopoides]|nr:hypothetical protein PV326_011851 [Microctonus aethiopoides]
MFQKQFNVGCKKKLLGLGDVCSFISIVYVKAWFEAPCPIQAPVQDLNFLKNLISLLTGSKNPEKMLLNKDRKLITPLFNNLDNTDTAFNIGIQQQYVIFALLRINGIIRPENIDLAPPDYRIHPYN